MASFVTDLFCVHRGEKLEGVRGVHHVVVYLWCCRSPRRCRARSPRTPAGLRVRVRRVSNGSSFGSDRPTVALAVRMHGDWRVARRRRLIEDSITVVFTKEIPNYATKIVSVFARSAARFVLMPRRRPSTTRVATRTRRAYRGLYTRPGTAAARCGAYYNKRLPFVDRRHTARACDHARRSRAIDKRTNEHTLVSPTCFVARPPSTRVRVVGSAPAQAHHRRPFHHLRITSQNCSPPGRPLLIDPLVPLPSRLPRAPAMRRLSLSLSLSLSRSLTPTARRRPQP